MCPKLPHNSTDMRLVIFYFQTALCLAAPTAPKEVCGWHITKRGDEPIYCDGSPYVPTTTLPPPTETTDAGFRLIPQSLPEAQFKLLEWFLKNAPEFPSDVSSAPVESTVPAKATRVGCPCSCIRTGSRSPAAWAWRSSSLKEDLRRRRQAKKVPLPPKPRRVVFRFGQNADSSSSSSSSEDEVQIVEEVRAGPSRPVPQEEGGAGPSRPVSQEGAHDSSVEIISPEEGASALCPSSGPSSQVRFFDERFSFNLLASYFKFKFGL